MDELVHKLGHAILRIGGHLTGLVQVEDTHAHGPMTKTYNRLEMRDSAEQLALRPDKLPCYSRATVQRRAVEAWHSVGHKKCTRGFVSNGIANSLDGSEDELLTKEVADFW